MYVRVLFARRINSSMCSYIAIIYRYMMYHIDRFFLYFLRVLGQDNTHISLITSGVNNISHT